MAETLTIRTASSTEVVKIASVGPQGPKGDKGDPGDVAGLPLTTQGDTLYRGAAANERLAIGTAGQVLKVSSGGIPEWGAESGAVSSVAGRTGAVVLAVADVADAVATSDARLSDARTPSSTLAHASTHHTGGTDAIAAHQINGQTIFSRESATYSADQTLPANRARQFVVSNDNAGGITLTLPTQAQGTLLGDTYVIVGGNTISGPITIRRAANLSPLVYNTLATITATGQQYSLRSNGGSAGDWALISVDTHTHTGSQVNVGTTANLPLKTGTNGVVEAGSFSNTAGSFCAGDDARLSDDRDPNLHAASHAAAGSDPVFDQDLATTDDVTFNSVSATDNVGTLKMDGYGLLWEGLRRWDLETSAFLDSQGAPMLQFAQEEGINAYLPIEFAGEDAATNASTTRDNLGLGDAAVEDTTAFAASGSITSSGLTQATARILGRTSSSTGAIEEIQIGSGLSLSAGELSATGGGGEVRSDFVSPYTYTGLADAGTSESTASWTIRRSEFDAGGSFVATLTASAVEWDDRLTASYS